MKKVYYFLIFYLIIGNSFLFSQNINQVVKKISKINVLHYYEKQSGEVYENWVNFEKLKEISTTQILVELLNNKNPVVKTYASFGLVDKKFSDIPLIYKNFIENDSVVETEDGSCTAVPEKISHELYFYYLRKLKDDEIRTDKILFQLDSLTIYNKSLENFNIYDGNTFIIRKVLTNRLFPKLFNNRISFLAFEKNNDYAIDYLSNWYKADYKKELVDVFIKKLIYFDKNDNGYYDFYEIMEQLLMFHEKEVNDKIIEILKKDDSWKENSRKYITLLNKYAIYDFGF